MRPRSMPKRCVLLHALVIIATQSESPRLSVSPLRPTSHSHAACPSPPCHFRMVGPLFTMPCGRVVSPVVQALLGDPASARGREMRLEGVGGAGRCREALDPSLGPPAIRALAPLASHPFSLPLVPLARPLLSLQGGRTLLHYAASDGHTLVVQALLGDPRVSPWKEDAVRSTGGFTGSAAPLPPPHTLCCSMAVRLWT